MDYSGLWCHLRDTLSVEPTSTCSCFRAVSLLTPPRLANQHLHKHQLCTHVPASWLRHTVFYCTNTRAFISFKERHTGRLLEHGRLLFLEITCTVQTYVFWISPRPTTLKNECGAARWQCCKGTSCLLVYLDSCTWREIISAARKW